MGNTTIKWWNLDTGLPRLYTSDQRDTAGVAYSHTQTQEDKNSSLLE